MKFNRFLQSAFEKNKPNKEKIRARALRAGNNVMIKIVAGVTAAVLLIGVVATGAYFGIMNMPTATACDLPQELIGISPINAVRADGVSGGRISDGSSFEVTTENAMSEEQFRSVFEITPNVDYSVKKLSGNKFEVTPMQAEKGAVYTVGAVVGGRTVYSWAFQTDDSFRVLSRTPNYERLDADTGAVTIEFSHADVENFESHFKIYPEIPGKFNHYGRKWSFTPTEPFEKNTLYTVTVDGGLSCKSGETLGEDYTFSFYAMDYEQSAYVVYGRGLTSNCFSPDKVPYAAIRARYAETDNYDSINVDVYKIKDAETFLELQDEYFGYPIVSGMLAGRLKESDKVESFTGNADNTSSGLSYKYVAYPHTYEKGYYISAIDYNGKTLYHAFQVNDISVYTVWSIDDCTVWATSSATGAPVSGTTVTLNKNKGKTDKDGVVTISGNEYSEKRAALTVENGGTPYVAMLNPPYSKENAQLDIDYYSYLQTNSEIYRPGDTVKIFGFTLPRNTDAAPLDNLRIYTSWDDRYYNVEKDGRGAFTCEIELSRHLLADFPNISLMSGNDVLYTESISIYDYVLPAYDMTVTTDKKLYRDGEQITYNAKVFTFDGMPAAGVTVNFNSRQTATTDKDGKVTFTQTARYNPYNEYGVNIGGGFIQADFTVTQPDGTSLEEYASVWVFPTDITAITDIGDSGIKATLYKINFDTKYENEYDYPTAESYKGEIYDAEVTVELWRTVTEKEQSNSWYNPITMETERSYTYHSYEEKCSSYTQKTENGTLTLEKKESDDPMIRYYYLLFADGGTGRLGFSADASGERLFDYIGEDPYTIETDKDEYAAGDSVKVNILCTDYDGNGKYLNSGKLLLTVANGDIVKNEVFDLSSGASFEFTKEFAPDCVLVGAYFDGDKTVPIETLTISEKRQMLDIKITADKQKYSPKDNVTLDIEATDPNGKPADAVLSVNAIDSALEKLAGNRGNIYDSVYCSRTYLGSIARTSSSYFKLTEDTYDMAEDAIEGGMGGAGGSDDYVRDDFEDTPYFEKVETGKDGKATVSFTLPDSITSWIVSVEGYDSDVTVGEGSVKLPSTKEFYISTGSECKIKETDDATFPIKTSAIGKIGDCALTIELAKDGKIISTETRTAQVNTTQFCSFGKLEKGEYTLTVSGTFGTQRDAVRRTITVAEGYNGVRVNESVVIGQSTELSNRYLTDLNINIHDEEQEFFMSVATSMLTDDSTRLENVIASAAAKAFFENDGEFTQYDKSRVLSFIADDGFSIFSDKDVASVENAAWIASVASELVESYTLISYFNDVLATPPTTEQMLYIYWAMAAMGEPVLAELPEIEKQVANGTDEQLICLALAYAYSGDRTHALNIYDKYVKGKFKSENGVTRLTSDTPYNTEKMTELAAMLALKLGAPEAKELVKTVNSAENVTGEKGIVLTSFVKDYFPILSGENSVKITHADGSTESVSYPRIGYATIILPYDEIAQTRFESEKGANVMTVTGDAYIKDLDKSKMLEGVEFTMSVIGEFESGKCAEISIHAKQPAQMNGCVKVKLPYSLKPMGIHSDNLQSGSEVTLYFDSSGLINKSITCYAAVPGEFKAEPAIMSDGESFAVSNELTINVK